jgi:ubiquinone/menaquinone biosynthesis C-methylase UbiE
LAVLQNRRPGCAAAGEINEAVTVEKEQFAEKMAQVLNLGALNLALGMGYKLGLFEALAEFMAPASSEAIAEKAGVSPRYLREWLGVVACGQVVEVSRDAQGGEAYLLPPEHAACLLRGSGLNLGVYTQEIPLLTRCAQQAVERGFASGQGVDWANYPDFTGFMAELADAKHKDTLVKAFLPSVDNGRMIERLEQGIKVCDLGCGSGKAALLMAQAFPNSHIVGLDISEEAIAAARRCADAESVGNLQYGVRDCADLIDDPAWADSFDYVTAFDAIHDQTRPEQALAGARHILKDGGLFSMVDIKADSHLRENLAHPMGPFLYAVSLMHCMPVGLNDQGAGLGMMWGRQRAERMLHEAGFSKVAVVEMDFDPFNLHYQCRK